MNKHFERQIIAWGDESIRISAPVPTYLMAATILPNDCNLAHLASLKPKGTIKLHWRELTDKVRLEAITEIAKIGGQTTIVAAAPLSKKKQERGRRKCLELLLPELERLNVSTLVLESRMLKLNEKDIEMLHALRVQNIVSNIRIEHAHASEQEQLLVPDQILGAYGDYLNSSDESAKWGQSWETVLSKLTIMETGI